MANNRIAPNVSVSEDDSFSITTSQSNTEVAVVASLNWGPVLAPELVNSENEFVNIFSKSTVTNYLDFLCITDFLSYAGSLWVNRVVSSSAINAGTAAGVLVKNADHYDTISFTGSSNIFVAKYPGVLGNALSVAFTDATGFNAVDTAAQPVWTYHSLFAFAPDANHFHIVVLDSTGEISGVPGTILEKFENVSTVSSDKNFDGSTAYVLNILRNTSEWIWLGKLALLTGHSNGTALSGGLDGSAPASGDYEAGWDMFADKSTYDIRLAFPAGASTTVAAYMIANVCELRADCVGCVGPAMTDVVNVTNMATALTNVAATKTTLGDTSFAFFDSNWKLYYDRYLDRNIWTPCSSSTAGLMAAVDIKANPWNSPAGYDNGNIKNCIALAQKWTDAYQDELYKISSNPIVRIRGVGNLLMGDRTMQIKPSAFREIGIRRLFIFLEKEIGETAKSFLFKQDDAITQATFVNVVEPLLDFVKGQRGLIDYNVVCNSSNNTPDTEAAQKLIADIYIQPTHSINYVLLNFVAINSVVQFTTSVVRPS